MAPLQYVKKLKFYLPAIVRGAIYIIYFRLIRGNVKIGFPFLAFSNVRIIGPGSVFIDKGCRSQLNVFRGLTIVTHSVDSTVRIGTKSSLGGLTIRCHERIEIGKRVMTALSLIQDSFFYHADDVSSRATEDIFLKAKPVIIGDNVWLGAGSIVLGGSRIGNDCVLSSGTCCFGNNIHDYSLVNGNPSKRPMPIDKLLKLRGIK